MMAQYDREEWRLIPAKKSILMKLFYSRRRGIGQLAERWRIFVS